MDNIESSERCFGTESALPDPLIGSLGELQPRRRGDAVVPRDVLAALTYGLELLRHGAVLTAHDGHPRAANRAAWAILQKRDGLWLERTGLVADTTTDTSLLRQLLHNVIKASAASRATDSTMILPRKAAHSPLIVRVVPGPALDSSPGTDNRTALMKIYDPDLGLETDTRALVRLYGLTRGEATLAAHLAKGKSIEGAAADLCISPHTARSQLKRIFMKTDTHRQTELVVRMLPAVL